MEKKGKEKKNQPISSFYPKDSSFRSSVTQVMLKNAAFKQTKIMSNDNSNFLWVSKMLELISSILQCFP